MIEEKGIVRKIDALGRVVIPTNIRNSLGIKSGDCLEIIEDSGNVILKKINNN